MTTTFEASPDYNIQYKNWVLVAGSVMEWPHRW